LTRIRERSSIVSEATKTKHKPDGVNNPKGAKSVVILLLVSTSMDSANVPTPTFPNAK
jgi:hypothetical protein